MKILLTAINAKYIHTNLAIYSLKTYASEYNQSIHLKQFTINNYVDDILQDIYKEKPDFIGFSCYIWNITMITELCVELRKVLPKVKIWLGGPEVSYDAKKILETLPEIDGIIIGEGEEIFKELLDYYIGKKRAIHDIQGIAYRETARHEDDTNVIRNLYNKEPNRLVNVDTNNGEIIETSFRSELDLSSIPFPYKNMNDFENKIIYYETSRGCPYSCSYCLSSIDKKVRLRNIDLVKEELTVFLKHKVPQVKFVDRTFNCNHKHAIEIWNHIKENDNGITNFHFEISADILNEEELQLLNSMRVGLVQLEIGVQSTNTKTIDAIQRRMDMDKLKGIVNRIHEGENIHQHLDLIAGLPYEDFNTFRNSFNEVYELKPDQLQLGFLKVLKGSGMYRDCKENGIIYKSKPPYEVLYTNWISFDELLVLKSVEEMVEIYYNSGQFIYAIKYMEHFFETPFDLYKSLGEYYAQNGYSGMQHARIRRYEILIQFMKEHMLDNQEFKVDIKAFQSILVHDLYLRENLKNQPHFADNQDLYKERYRNFYRSEDKIREALTIEPHLYNPGQYKQYIHIEHYNIDVVKTALSGVTAFVDMFLVYDYFHRNPLDNSARVQNIEL
jgi:radical SAM superfamily enzyme YgiQ (UPF0313 family)